MLEVVPSSKFRHDVKRMKKRGKDMEKLKALIALLAAGKPLPRTYLAHPLKGDWKSHWDAHIEPDWLLIYQVADGHLHLVRRNSHVPISFLP